MDPLLESLGKLKDEFAGDDDVEATVDREIKRLNEWIADNTGPEPEEIAGRKLGVETPGDFHGSSRSIFDDVDV